MRNRSMLMSMFFKKVLLIGFMAVAIILCSMAALAEDKKGSEIFTSSVQTPPPGYVIEKSFGDYVVVKEDSFFGSVNSKDILKAIGEATNEAAAIVKKVGGNASLAETIRTQVISHSGGGDSLYVTLQGEAVLLKPVSK